MPVAPLTSKEIERYKESKKYYICFKPFTEKNPKVRDHCHYTGNYKGAAHRNCNLQYKIPPYIPIVFHNLSGYEAHLFIKELAASVPGGAKMGVIAKNKEDYITFSIKVAVDKYIDKKSDSKLRALRAFEPRAFEPSSLRAFEPSSLEPSSPGPCDSCFKNQNKSNKYFTCYLVCLSD